MRAGLDTSPFSTASRRPLACAVVPLALVCATAGCHARTDRLDLGLRDPTRVRVELRAQKLAGGPPSTVSLDEGEQGRGRAVVTKAGLLADRYDLESRVARAPDGALTLHVARLPDPREVEDGMDVDDEEDVAPTLDPDYVKSQALWSRRGDQLTFVNAPATAKTGTFVDSRAATWRFDRRTPRLAIETHASLAPGTSGWVINGNTIEPPGVVLSTPMSNVRWARTVTVERASAGWWLLLAGGVGAGLSATMFHLSARGDDPPVPFFFGLGVGSAAIGLLSAGFAAYTFARGNRETKRDLVAPMP